MPSDAKESLIAQRDVLRREKLAVGDWDLVFPSEEGTPMNSDNPRGRFLGVALKECGLHYVTLHELRHTFASILLHEWLAPPAVISKTHGPQVHSLHLRPI